MEVLVLLDFEGTMGDEITVHAGDVVKNVTESSEEGWLEGELRGKRGIFPANFVKEVPIYLKGDNKREPRSMRKTKMTKEQCRKCEVTFAYTPLHQDELELVVGETIEIIREIEDGWWMGKKGGKIGAFPSNFAKEIFVCPKDVKSRAKLSEAIFIKEGAQQQRASIRKKTNVKECCQVMFDYTANAEDELELKKGDIITVINKVNDDDGWWEGELNGRRGFFPDNFVMIIPMEIQEKSQPPLRRGTIKHSVKQISGMDRSITEGNTKEETKDEKSEAKDIRSEIPGKIKLPGLFKAPPPPIKDKPQKVISKPSDDQPPVSPKPIDSKPKDSDQFDEVDVSSAKLNHPTANRAKPPQRRPPSHTPASSDTNQNETPASTQTDGADKKHTVALKDTGNNLPLNNRTNAISTPEQPNLSKTQIETKPVAVQEEKPTLENVLVELRELRMEMELFKTRHDTDIKELKIELNEERSKRMKLQDEVHMLRKQK